jgi:hypothetical protein
MEQEMDTITTYLNQTCIQDLKECILKEKPLQISYEDLIHIYTYVYNKCIKDKERVYCNFFYNYYKSLIIEFIRELIQNNYAEKNKIHKCITDYKKYKFYVKNLSIMFRILNKHYLIKHNYEDLNKIAEHYFNDNYLLYEHFSILHFLEQEYIHYKSKDYDKKIMNQFFKILKELNYCFTNRYYDTYFSCISHYYNSLKKEFETLNDFYNLLFYFIEYENNVIDNSMNVDYKERISILLMSSFKDEKYNHLIENVIVQICKDFYIPSLDFLLKYDSQYLEMVFKKELDKNEFTFPGVTKLLSHLPLNSRFFQIAHYWFSQKLTENSKYYRYIFEHIFIHKQDIIYISFIKDQETFIDLFIPFFYSKCFKFQTLHPEIILFLNQLKIHLNTPINYKLDIIANDLQQSLTFHQHLKSNQRIFIFSKFQEKGFLSLTHLPSDIDSILSGLKTQYKSIYPNRNLLVNYYKSIVEVEMTFQNKMTLLQMSFIQYVLLQLIVQYCTVTCAELCQRLNVSYEDIKGILHSLTIPSQNIILKSGESHWIDKQKDTFSFHIHYPSSSPKTIFKMPVIEKQMSMIQDKEYKFVVQSKIMKFLKHSKTASMNEIQSHLYQYDIQFILDNINYLIDLEYIEKKNDNYHYVL